MKVQDILFLFIFGFFIWKAQPKFSALVGIISLIFAIPLFSFWVFFTAERLTWYGAAFLLLSCIQVFQKIYHENRN